MHLCVYVCLSCIIWLLSNCWAVYCTQCQNFKLVVTVTQQFGTSLHHHYGLDRLTFSSKSLFTYKSHEVIQLRSSCLTSLPGPPSRGHDLINEHGFDFFCLTQMRQRPNNLIQLLLGLFTFVTPCSWEWAVIFQNKKCPPPCHWLGLGYGSTGHQDHIVCKKQQWDHLVINL